MTPLLHKLDPDGEAHIKFAADLAMWTFRRYPDGNPDPGFLDGLEIFCLKHAYTAVTCHGGDDADALASRDWIAREWATLYAEAVDARRSREAAE